MKNFLFLFITAALVAIFPSSALTCTTMLITKGATKDGSVLVSHSDDDAIDDRRIIFVPAMDHEPGTMRPVYYDSAALGFKPEYTPTRNKRYVGKSRGPGYDEPGLPLSKPLGSIPQVAHTYAYFDGSYGIMNEHQLGIGECSNGAKVGPGPEPGKRIFYSAELSRVALERCKKAREAVQLMGELIEEYGYYGTGETLLVGDTEEGWVFEMCGYDEKGSGGLWVAKKVPDGEVFVAANEFRIREIDPEDPDMMFSKNLFEVAREKGWWSPEDGKLDWLKAVSHGEYGHPYYSLRRVWRAMSRMAPSLNLPAWVVDGFTKAYPFSIKPEKKLAVADVISLHRDHYEGTEFDLRKGFAAGPHGTPNRYPGPYDKLDLDSKTQKMRGAWERPLSVFRCGYVYVNQLRGFLPSPVGGVCWFGNDRPYENCLVPFYAGMNSIPDSFSKGDVWRFDRNTALWAFNFVANYADLNYSHMIKDIQIRQAAIEGEQYAHQPAVEQAAMVLYKSGNVDLCKKYLTNYCSFNADRVVKEWWALAEELIVKYNDGYLVVPGRPEQNIGYPDWWLEKTGYFKGPTTYRKP